MPTLLLVFLRLPLLNTIVGLLNKFSSMAWSPSIPSKYTLQLWYYSSRYGTMVFMLRWVVCYRRSIRKTKQIWMDIRTSGTEFGSFSYISSIDSAYRLEAPERKLSFDLLLAWVENDNEEEEDVMLLLPAATTAPRRWWAWWLVVQGAVVFEIILREASIITRREAARRSACDVMMLMMRSIDEFALWYYWWWLLL